MVEVCNCDCLPILPLHRAQLTAMQPAHSTSLKACKEQAQVGHLLSLHPTALYPKAMFLATSSLIRNSSRRSGNPSKLHPQWTGTSGAPRHTASDAPVATHIPSHQ